MAGAAIVALLVGGTVGYVRVSAVATDELPVAPDHYQSSPVVCNLLRDADLEAALGRRHVESFDPSLSLPFSDLPGRTKCAYRTGTRQTVEIAVLYAYVEQLFSQMERGRKQLQFDAEAVPGLGRRALWYPGARELVVLSDDKIVGVYIDPQFSEPPAEARERARRLAHKILDRLRS